jgi:arsenate reductase
MDKITVYGIPNCDTIKKTLDWLKKNKIDFEFHDYKKAGISKTKLTGWCKKTAYDILLNKKSTTWRELPVTEQEKVINQATAIQLMMENTSIIKRPVVEYEDKLLVGFNETVYKRALNK